MLISLFMLCSYAISAWDVVRPLSASTSAPFSILDLVRPQSQPPAARTPKRSRARMETSQREEIRRSLKAAIIWVSCHHCQIKRSVANTTTTKLILKGLEPIFDNFIGYLMPFYSASKAITLLIYIAFRPEVSRRTYHLHRMVSNSVLLQLSRHLFDTFVLPIGKPNTPLLDLSAINSIILPTARFLLSLPFAHLVVAVKNQLEPFMQSWSGQGGEEEGAVEEAGSNTALEYRRSSNAVVAPPAQRATSSLRQPSMKSSFASSRSASGKGGDGDGQGGGSLDAPLTARKKISSDSLSSLSRISDSRPSSISQARALLDTLPPAPRDSLTSRPSQSASASGSVTHPILQTFAFIPPATPPQAQHKNAAMAPLNLVTPRMPGFLGGQAPINGFNMAVVSSASSTSLGGRQARTEDELESAAKETNGTKTVEENGGEEESTPVRISKTTARSTAASAARRKRAEEESELPPKKMRASPSRSKSARSKSSTSTSTDAEMTIKKSASTARLPSSSSLATAQARSTVSRTRKKAA